MLRGPLCCHIPRQAPTTLNVSVALPVVASPSRSVAIVDSDSAPCAVLSPPQMATTLNRRQYMALNACLSHFVSSPPNGLTTWFPCLVRLGIPSSACGPRYANIARPWTRYPWFLALVLANRPSYLHGVGMVDAIADIFGDGLRLEVCRRARAPSNEQGSLPLAPPYPHATCCVIAFLRFCCHTISGSRMSHQHPCRSTGLLRRLLLGCPGRTSVYMASECAER